jgi:asparagine synthase (glutamine-hydrolysing)
MADAIRHRGPDEDGFYSDDAVNLGMRRLSIIDPATGRQPLHNEDSRLWVVMNGEIYNAPELRREMEARGHRFYTDHSDTETLPHLYEEYGDDFPTHLNGMFAAALWDRVRRRLLLVRDRMGVKPLFYRVANGRLIFGSEIKALLAHPDCPKEMDRAALYHYFTFKHVPAPRTAFAGISVLKPGEQLVFEDGEAKRQTWWRPSFREDRTADEPSAKERILSILDDATRIRMRSDVPFGAYLSGGLDSSAVVTLMRRARSGPLLTFSLGYEEDFRNKASDLTAARRVAKSLGTVHHEYLMSARELEQDAGDIQHSFDQPFSGTVSTFFLTKLISKHVKVALSGDGADELFGSYLSHRTAGPIHRYGALREKALSGKLTAAEAHTLQPCDSAFLERLFAASGGDEAAWRCRLHLFADEEKRHLLSREFLHAAAGEDSLDMIREDFRDVQAADPLNRVLEMEYKHQFPDQVLAFLDSLSMAHSVEVRSPFLDYRLVEFAAALPESLKIRGPVVKSILKDTFRDLLPPGVADRPKEGFVLPVNDWLAGSLREWPAKVLSRERMARHGCFDAETVLGLTKAMRPGDAARAGKIWNLMMFQIWWERYFG